MTEQRTYLELSEETGAAHKFYEVVTSGSSVTVTYGRIGARGQTTVTDFATPQKAAAAAAKKLDQKRRKGYLPAQRGVTASRPISRRSTVSTRSTANRAPVLWQFRSGSPAYGIFVDEERCWMGNQRGDVFTVSHTGQVTGRFSLPSGVKCLVADDFWIYAGCDDGKVYDLGGKAPRVAYEIAANVDIYWLDIDDATLGVSDAKGRITTIDHEDEFQWSRESTGDSGWMIRCDQDAVYHGHSQGVARFASADGKPQWHTDVHGNVLFGWQERDSVYAGTGNGRVYRLGKQDGTIEAVYQCDAAVFACATAPDGRFVFAGDSSSSIYCFDKSGERLWKLATNCHSAFSMQYLDERLYIVTTDGTLACIDASVEAITKAQNGSVPTPLDVKVAASMPVVDSSLPLETVTVSQAGNGIVVECFQDGSRLRVRVVSAGYDSGLNVQFPKDIRQPGARYLVEGIRQSDRGGFYRTYGDIKRLR